MMRKVTVIGLVALLIALEAVGCSQATPAPKTTPPSAPTPASTPSPAPASTPSPSPTPKPPTSAPAPAPAAKTVTLKLASHVAPTYSIWGLCKDFAQKVTDRTNGQVKFNLFPSEQLVKATEQFDALSAGTIDVSPLPDSYFTGNVPLFMIEDLPFLFNDYDGGMAALRGGLRDMIQEQVAGRNIVVLGFGQWGSSNWLSNTKMPKKPEDLAGLTVRVVGEGTAKAAAVWGAAPVLLASGELYLALQRGTISGLVTPLGTAASRRLYEVVKYAAVSNGQLGLASLGINKTVWSSLPSDVQGVIQQAAREFEDSMVKSIKDEDASAIEQLKKGGMQVYVLTPEEKAVWKKASKPVWDWWVQKAGPVGQKVIDIALKYNP